MSEQQHDPPAEPLWDVPPSDETKAAVADALERAGRQLERQLIASLVPARDLRVGDWVVERVGDYESRHEVRALGEAEPDEFTDAERILVLLGLTETAVCYYADQAVEILRAKDQA